MSQHHTHPTALTARLAEVRDSAARGLRSRRCRCGVVADIGSTLIAAKTRTLSPAPRSTYTRLRRTAVAFSFMALGVGALAERAAAIGCQDQFGFAVSTNTRLSIAVTRAPLVNPYNPPFMFAFSSPDGFMHTFDEDEGDVQSFIATSVGTSPSITALSTGGWLSKGGYEAAINASDGYLHVWGTAGTENTHLPIAPNTNPSIAASPKGGYKVAFQGTDGDMWTDTPAGGKNQNLAMAAGTSPSITALPSGGYEAAAQTIAGYLALWSDLKTANTYTYFPVARGTSPAIAGSTDRGFLAVMQGADSHLYTYDPTSGIHWYIDQLAPGHSPSIMALDGSGYEVAYRGIDNSVVVWGSIDSNLTLPYNAAYAAPPSESTTDPAITAIPITGWSTNLWGWIPGPWITAAANLNRGDVLVCYHTNN